MQETVKQGHEMHTAQTKQLIMIKPALLCTLKAKSHGFCTFVTHYDITIYCNMQFA